MNSSDSAPADVEGIAALVATSALSEDEARSRWPEATRSPQFDHWLAIHRDTLAAVSAPEATPAPAGLRKRLLREVAQRSHEPRSTRAPWFFGAAAAAAIVVGAGAWVAFNPTQEQAEVYAANVADGTLTITLEPGGDVARLELDNVPPPPEGTVFQMWVSTSDGARSLGSMGPADVTDHTQVEVGGFRDASEFMITAEAGGAAEAPSEPLVLVPLD